MEITKIFLLKAINKILKLRIRLLGFNLRFFKNHSDNEDIIRILKKINYSQKLRRLIDKDIEEILG